MAIDVRPVSPSDVDAWSALYRGYRAFYELPEDAASVTRTWEWMIDGRHGLVGLVALDEGAVVGLANLRWFARPSTASIGLYLDDLFTLPASRARGVGRALLTRAAVMAAEEGASVVRWITAADNTRARRLYDDVATSTPWVTYDMSPLEA